jgi:hypothetical protein
VKQALTTIAALMAGALVGISGASAGDGYGPSEKLIRGGVSQYALGNRDLDSTDKGSGQTFELSSSSAYNIPLWRSVSMQIDSASEYYFKMNGPTDAKSSNVLGMHLSYRDPNRGLLGVFGGYAWSNVKTVNGNSGNYDMAFFGAEAQAYVGNLTLYAQAGRGNNTQGDTREGFNSGWFTRGVARYFLRPDTKLEAEVSYAQADPYIDGNDKGKFTGWGVSLDHKLFNVLNYPVYGTLAYRGAYYDATTEEDHATEHVVKAGIKVLFGANTLQQNDRYGATLDLPMLPVRANSLTENID